MDTRQTLANIAVKEFHCDAEKISEDATIKDLGIDSLGLLEFIFRIEEVFAIRISNEDAEKLTTLSDIANLVDRLRTLETA
jgi:acyl carrier protein